MSSNSLSRFSELVGSDPVLAQKVRSVASSSPEDAAAQIASLSADAGSPVSKEDCL